MPELKKLIWEGLSQLFPDHVCTSIQHGYSYLFFKGFKIIYNVDNSIDVLDVHIKTDYYIDKYGVRKVKDYTIVDDFEILEKLKRQIDVEINNKQDILPS